MMAVDTKQGTSNAPAGTPGPAATLAGIPAMSANGKPRKRPSSLMAQASALPSVENSLDEFIAKANETLLDPSTFNSAEVRREEDEKRKEQDALRWKATEQQMRVAQEREEALRRQLSGLQGQLAEAEARAAVAGSGGSQDGIIADLKLRLTMADEKIRASEEQRRLSEGKIGKLEQDLASAQSAATVTSAPAARDSLVGMGDDEAEQRVRLAEAKATKALAAAKAASAGLTVSAADIAAIESGLAVSTMEPAKKTPWGLIAAAFIVGGAIMFAIAFVVLKGDKPATSAGAHQHEGEPAAEKAEKAEKAEAAPAKVTATPIEDKAAAPAEDKAAPAEDKVEAAAPAEDDKAAKAADEAAAKEAADKAAADDAAAAKAEKAAAAKAAAAEAAAAKAEKAAAAKAAASKKAPAKKAPAKKASSAIADPFGDAPAPAKKKKKDSAIVDPF